MVGRSGRGEGRRRTTRVDDRVAIAVAAVAGIVAATSSASPTGATAVDAILLATSVGLVTWASASAPWWAVAGAAGIAAATAGDLVLLVVGALAFGVGLWVGTRQRALTGVRAAVAGVAMNVLVRSELDGALGLSAFVGVSIGVALLALGLRRRRRSVQLWVAGVAGGVAALAVVAIAGFAVAASGARTDLTDGNRLAREAIGLLNDGEYAEAATRFDEAATAFADADDRLSAVWAQPARAVPIVAPNRTAATELAATAAEASADLASALAIVDPDSLRLVNGRFDLASIELVEQPLVDVQTSLDDLRRAIDEVESPWLVGAVQDRLESLSVEIDDNEVRLDNAVLAVQLAPELLGSEGPRTYFVAFTTPAEARGLGGFMGNFAELTADDGRLTMTRFGRTVDLNRPGGQVPTDRRVTGPADWLEEWGRFGFTSGTDGTTGDVPWSNVTVSPHFPSTAQVIAELYPQSGGRELDGVFAMDPYVLQALLGLTGPIDIAGTDEQLTEANVVEFLLVDQYEIDDREGRLDLLEQVAESTIGRVLTGALPSPTEVARALGPLAAEGRLVGWSRDPVEQDLFERVRLSGAMPALEGGDGVAVVHNNAVANKIDVYLGREVSYRARVDPATGEATGTVEVVVTNGAPSAGLPDGVLGNYTDEPPGTNRTFMTVYTALRVLEVSLDGEPVDPGTGTEAGRTTTSLIFSIPPGGSRTVVLEVAGTLDGPYSLATRPQPLVIAEEHDLEVVDERGRPVVGFEGPATQPRRFNPVASAAD